MPASQPPLPSKIGIIIFPGFQLLDFAGPLDCLNILAHGYPLDISILAHTLDPVSTENRVQIEKGSHVGQKIVPTHTFASPPDLDVLIIPGGLGSRGPGSEENMAGVVEFLNGLDLSGKGSIKYVLTVCTGSEILARTGLLEGRRATTNKKAFNEVKAKHPSVSWIAAARWVVDGNIWTSSGISAGIDVTFAWIAEVYGEEVAQDTADKSEYVRNTNKEGERFAERWGAV